MAVHGQPVEEVDIPKIPGPTSPAEVEPTSSSPTESIVIQPEMENSGGKYGTNNPPSDPPEREYLDIITQSDNEIHSPKSVQKDISISTITPSPPEVKISPTKKV